MVEIKGAGGGKSGGGGGGISESPDTLSSVAFARFVDLISEGPIKGLVNGQYSIYLDGVPLRNLTGTANYKPFTWDSRTGTQTQTTIRGFAGTQQEVEVGIQFQKSQGKIVRAIPDADADAVRVTIAVQGLSQTSSNGKVSGAKVEYRIFARVVGGSWGEPLYDGAIDGKTQARYQRAHEIPLSTLGDGPYEVAVERVTNDSISALLTNDTFWDSYTIINYEQYTYPNSALVAVEIDARYFSQIPERRYHIQGLLVRVPTNYNPSTRKYTGVWDGTWKTAYSNNPAWCYYDLVTNTRYGLGKRINANEISKWTMYEIAKYCDELVPTGLTANVFDTLSQTGFSASGKNNAGVPVSKQNMEPRFTLNVVINTKEDAYRVLNNLSSVFRGMTYWSSSGVTVTQDRPTTSKFLWTNANVVDRIFNYEGSSRSQRHTTVSVGWNDPEEDFRQKYEYVEDRAGIQRYGVRHIDIVAFGCTSRSQARRVGLWLLYTERMEAGAVTFKVGMEGAVTSPGDVGQIMDSNRVGARWGGRIMEATSTVVTLDAPITLTAGAYTLSVMKKDGTIMQRAVNIGSTALFTELTAATAFPEVPTVGFLWTLASTVVKPMLARVVSVKQIEAIIYEITAIQHEPGKYASIDLGAAFKPNDYSFLSYDSVPKVKNLFARENSYKETVTSPVRSDIEVSWDTVNDPLVRGYIVKYTIGNKTKTVPEDRDPFVEIQNVGVGAYVIQVTAVNHLGIKGPVATYNLTVTGRDSTPPSDVQNFRYTFSIANGLQLSWDPVLDFIDYYEIREGESWELGTKVDQPKSTSRNLGNVAVGEKTYWIKARDTGGNYSESAASILVDIAGAPAPIVTFAIIGTDEEVSWLEPDSVFTIDGYVIREGTTFETSVLVDTVRSLKLRRKINWTGEKKYWVAAKDVVGNIGEYGVVEARIIKAGPIRNGRVQVIDNNVLLYWDKPDQGSLPVESYQLLRGATFAGATLIGTVSSTFMAIFENASGEYRYWLVPVDSALQPGVEESILATVSQPPDYVLKQVWDSTLSATRTNIAVDTDGSLVGPVNTTETWEEHFTSRGWASIQDQVTAGFPLYAQPSVATATYDEVFNYDAVIGASTITVTVGQEAISGAVPYSVQIYWKKLPGDDWTAGPVGATVVRATDFQYVRVEITWTSAATTNLFRFKSLNVRIDSKKLRDSGKFAITTSPASGVWVPFTVPFADAETPRCQANGTTKLDCIVDFEDEPNPTGFQVYLVNDAGTFVTGSGGWETSGF